MTKNSSFRCSHCIKTDCLVSDFLWEHMAQKQFQESKNNFSVATNLFTQNINCASWTRAVLAECFLRLNRSRTQNKRTEKDVQATRCYDKQTPILTLVNFRTLMPNFLIFRLWRVKKFKMNFNPMNLSRWMIN